MLLSFFVMILFYQEPGAEYSFVSSMGREINGRILTEDQKAHALDNMEELNRFVVDPYTDFQIQGRKMYVDAEGLESERVLIIVSPKNNSRAVLELDPFDFIQLILESTMWGIDDSSRDYFYLYPYNLEVLKGGAHSSRFIDPHECNNTHPQDEPHRTEPGNNDAPCHGAVGQNGMCGTTTSSVDYFVSCNTWQSGNGQSTNERCIGHIECLNGAGFANGTSLMTRVINCNSAVSGMTTMTAGIDDMGRAFVTCGSDIMTLDCPK